MCGFAGFIDTNRAQTAPELAAVARAMNSAIANRGPDDSGEWADAEAGVVLGFRRLAIIDLSPAGHQPMRSASGRYVIVFNGEVYNFRAIRAELEQLASPPSFRGHSDTEVILAAIQEWGLEHSVKKFIGMFAFALWDRRDRLLHLVRDRVGVKPLYYGRSGATFLFGSELKALRVHPAFCAEIDRNALALYMRHSYIPAPHTIYRRFMKLPAGMIATLNCNVDAPRDPILKQYWSAKTVAESGVRNRFKGTEREAIDELDALVRDSVGLRAIADVPLGVFLSGGIDSSVVAATLQAQSSSAVKTFTIGFAEDEYNEAPHAKEIARHLGTAHTELYVTASQARDVIPQLPTLFDEPFADSSQIPTYLVSQLARRYVTVSLSGDGGDELFGGYVRYFLGPKLWNKFRRLPLPVRAAASKFIHALSEETLGKILKTLSPITPRSLSQRHLTNKVRSFGDLLASRSSDAIYLGLVSAWRDPNALVIGSASADSALTDASYRPEIDDFAERMMYFDLVTYLPDELLVKMDRASMGVSLEAREPLLDHRLIEFAWRLPLDLKIRDGEGKSILKKVLDRYVPRALVDRPKMGFGVPIEPWLRGPLREWADELLDGERIRREGFLNPAPIVERWQEHRTGRRAWQSSLWNVIVFQQWLEAQSTCSPVARDTAPHSSFAVGDLSP